MSSTGAYTAVPARRTFGHGYVDEPVKPFSTAYQPSPPASTNNTSKGKRDWPPPVRSYVQRSFAEGNMIPDVDREEMEKKLKLVISHSVEAGTLADVDWDNLPLPQMMIQNERAYEHDPRLQKSPSVHKSYSKLSLQETNQPMSKKRKSSDLHPVEASENRTSPWKQSADLTTFENRISYPDKRPRHGAAQENLPSKSSQAANGRKKRFENLALGSSPVPPWRPSTPHDVPSKQPEGPIIGRCQELEKKYFRLTSAPNPDTVRPLPVLERTLDHLKKKWRQERNYSYICDQFKSLRQDLTVQRIKTGFTVNAYEIHARIALEKGDLGEYNQCQTQLRALYAQNLGGHPTEFLAYRILYFLHTSNRTEMNDVLADLTNADKQDLAVKHALDTRSALALGNYHKFFQLYLETPNMGAYLMDMFVARERLSALSAVCRAYKPDVKLRFVTEELGFESDDESARFICDNGAQHSLEERTESVHLLTSKASISFEQALKAASTQPHPKAST
ncbi:MAG: hypothetical protein Q9222_002662 [Ikaeria aurantiellina]